MAITSEPLISTEQPTWVRYRVLGMLCLLTFILYLDRICIGQAVSDIEDELDITHEAMGYVLAAFTLAYGLFEVPTGHWGDRYGSRGVLTRIVLWWSVFTMLTGAAPGLITLLVVRFLFGAGEAGALPNAARVVARWFPPGARGPAQGVVITSAMVGGAVAPVVAAALIHELGWRWTFALLGVPGVLWAIVFYWWFRDDPAQHPAVNERERDFIRGGQASITEKHPPMPWGKILTSPNVWLLGSIISCNCFTTYMFFSWYPTYLQLARGVSKEQSGVFASLVLAAGAVSSLLGGYLSDWLVRMTGDRRWTRRGIGFFALVGAAASMLASIHFDEPWMSVACAALASLSLHLSMGAWWGVVTEISGKHLGALFGLMNSMGLPGAIGSQIFLGWYVDRLAGLGYFGRDQWDSAFYYYGIVLLIGACCWLFVDAKRSAVE